ncbi:MAG: alpha/beta hydrolase [bacterium]|nr:alpha/beta hydrolase [bacterium]
MNNPRIYGHPPFKIAVVHGGPGAPGEMAPVALELAKTCGVLEPLQTATTVDGQVEELRALLERCADLPVTLIGHSWGAWLSFILVARYPALVNRLILVGSGPFEAEYAAGIMDTRLSRLTEEERTEVVELFNALDDPCARRKDEMLARLGRVISRTDTYAPLPAEGKVDIESIACNGDINESVWKEAAELRRSGRLLALGEKISCPVTAIHGDYDPHPAAGVREPLSRVLKDFEFILLERCGHNPWMERYAVKEFFRIIASCIRADS